MSLFQAKELGCPNCGETIRFDVIFSVNAARRPDLRQQILDGTFQQGSCAKCQTTFRLAPELSYLDTDLGLWLLVQPVEKLAQWPALETQARSTFEKAYGPKVSAIAREIGSRLTVRVTFGWAALREKLVCAQAKLSDVELELTKLALIRSAESLPLQDDVELRLGYVEEDQLWFAWIRAAQDEMLEMVGVPRSLYDDIAADQTAWQPLRDELSSGTFVDVHRLLVEPAEMVSGEPNA